MDEARAFDFLDVITIMALGLQLQEHIVTGSQPSNRQLMDKLDYIIKRLDDCVPNTCNEGTHP